MAPFYPEVVHIIVRKGSGIQSIADLGGCIVLLGPSGSGMRQSALQILGFYGLPQIQDERDKHYFGTLLEDTEFDAAIVTTGMDNPDLMKLLRTGDFDLLPFDIAAAISLKSAHFKEYEIPRGYYAALPPVPETSVKTVAATAFLATNPNTSAQLVIEVLQSLYGQGLKLKIPHLIGRKDVLYWTPTPLHPVAKYRNRCRSGNKSWGGMSNRAIGQRSRDKILRPTHVGSMTRPTRLQMLFTAAAVIGILKLG